MIEAVRYARESGIPYLGICLGLQIAVIEFARNVLGLSGADSTEFDPDCENPVIALVTEWTDQDGVIETRAENEDMGGTMRLGAQSSHLEEGSLCRDIYGSDEIFERHRHRYEVNNRYLDRLREGGLSVSGFSSDGLVEMIELPNHPWFVACQFHPEFTSTPRDGHPLFRRYVEAAVAYREGQGEARRARTA